MSKYTTMTETAQAAAVDIQELKEQRRLLEFEKIKMRDERNEVSRLYRQQARKESLDELFTRVVRAIRQYNYILLDLKMKRMKILRF